MVFGIFHRAYDSLVGANQASDESIPVEMFTRAALDHRSELAQLKNSLGDRRIDVCKVQCGKKVFYLYHNGSTYCRYHNREKLFQAIASVLDSSVFGLNDADKGTTKYFVEKRGWVRRSIVRVDRHTAEKALATNAASKNFCRAVGGVATVALAAFGASKMEEVSSSTALVAAGGALGMHSQAAGVSGVALAILLSATPTYGFQTCKFKERGNVTYETETNSDIFSTGNIVLAPNTKGFIAFSFKNPDNPIILGKYNSTRTAISFTVSNGQGAVPLFDSSSGNGYVQLFKVNEQGVGLQGSAKLKYGGGSCSSANGDLLVVAGGNGIDIFNISKPFAPRIMSSFQPFYQFDEDVLHPPIFQDSLFFLNSVGMEIYDISDPSFPSKRASFAPPNEYDGFNNLVVRDEIAYLVGSTLDMRTGLEIGAMWTVNVSEPTKPTLLGTCATASVDENFAYIHLYKNFALVTLTAGKEAYPAYLIDVSKPAFPRMIGPVIESANGPFAISGDYAYMQIESLPLRIAAFAIHCG